MATKNVPLLLIGMAATPPIVTLVGLLKLLPVMVTKVPTGPLIGEKLVIVGCATNVHENKIPPMSSQFFIYKLCFTDSEWSLFWRGEFKIIQNKL
jgi:hypothetical protein